MGVDRSKINAQTGQATTIDTVGDRNKNEGNASLKPYCCYQGRVVETNYATRTLTVMVNRVTIHNCLYTSGAAASVLGVSSYQLPAPGSVVACLYTPQATFVIGTVQQVLKPEKIPMTSATGDTKYHVTDDFAVETDRTKEYQKEFAAPGAYTASDVTPVEQEYGNDMGIVLRFLTNMIQVDAGGLSLIEQCLANDMVRIFSNYFVHHNCGGDTMIWSNGRCNYEQHFTGYPHEAAGKEKEDSTIAAPVAGEGIYTDERKLDDIGEIVDHTGRWRESTYLGFLGDMLHFWVTNPTKVVSNYAEGAARAGQIRTWVGADGTLVVQGAGDIMIEATSYMVIPQILHKWDNPELDTEKMMSELDNEYLKVWGTGDTRWDDLNASVWQMRQYLRYLTIWHSLARFRQVSVASEGKYCVIPPEKDSKVGGIDCDEQDKKDAGAESPKVKPYKSILRCSPDGSQTLIASGENGISSVILNQGNIQLSAANNIEIKASGTVSITGKNVSVKAHHMLELVSLCGSIAQKARTAWKALCEAGRVWLKSDMPIDGSKQAGDGSMNREWDDYSVVIDSSNGKTLVHGNKVVTVGTTDPDSHIYIEALNGVSDVNVYGFNVNTIAQNSVYTNSNSWGVSCSQSVVSSYIHRIGEHVSFTPASVDIDCMTRMTELYTNSTFAMNGYVGNWEYNLMYNPDDPPEGTEPEVEHDATDALEDEIKKLNKGDNTDDFPKNEFQGTYRMWSLYPWACPQAMSDPDSLKQDPWTDEVLFVSDDEEQKYDVVKFVWNPDARLLTGPRTDSGSCPWPGSGASINTFSRPTVRLTNTMEEDFKKEDICSVDDMWSDKLVYVFKESSYE